MLLSGRVSCGCWVGSGQGRALHCSRARGYRGVWEGWGACIHYLLVS